MTDKEMEILLTISKALPLMYPFDKGYFLEDAESKASEAGKLHIEEDKEPDKVLV